MFLFRNGGMRMSFARHKRDLARPVDIIGVGASQLGMVCDTPGMLNMTTRELWSWAASEALNDAGIPATEIEALFVGNMIAEHTEGQYHLPYVLAQWTGLGLGQESWRSAVRIEAACASSSQAIRPVSYTHLRAHETRHDLVCRLLLEKKKKKANS